MEVFKPIKGYEGLYEISNLGRVKSLPKFHKTGFGGYTEKEKILTNRKDSYGYEMVMLCKDRKQINYLVHRLVANAFLENPIIMIV